MATQIDEMLLDRAALLRLSEVARELAESMPDPDPEAELQDKVAQSIWGLARADLFTRTRVDRVIAAVREHDKAASA